MLGGGGLLDLGEPRIPSRVLAGVVGIQVDEAALDLPVADLEHVAPPPGAPLRHASAPGAILVLAVAGPLTDHDVAAREDPVEGRVVVADRPQRRADVAEHPADLLPAAGQPPLGEGNLC